MEKDEQEIPNNVKNKKRGNTKWSNSKKGKVNG